MVSAEYYSFLDVFNKKGTNVLPPHRTYDSPIELLPGAVILFEPIFPLSEPGLETLRVYIEENLKKGFIRPSTSTVGAGIFCMDYRELNKITVKNR